MGSSRKVSGDTQRAVRSMSEQISFTPISARKASRPSEAIFDNSIPVLLALALNDYSQSTISVLPLHRLPSVGGIVGAGVLIGERVDERDVKLQSWLIEACRGNSCCVLTNNLELKNYQISCG